MQNEEWRAKFEPCMYSNRLLDKLIWLNNNIFTAEKLDILEIQKAIYYARKYHGEQKRQSGEPYYSHPLEVAYLFAEYAIMENKRYFRTDLLVSCILHDTIEDTTLTEEMIAQIFGNIVASQVESLTRIKVYGKISSEELVNSLLLRENRDVLMIKLFDRLHNIQTIKFKSPDKIDKIIGETIRVFLLLSAYLEMPQIKNILIRFCYEHLNMRQNTCSLTNINSVFDTNSYQLPSLTPQNDLGLINTLQ